MFLTPVLQPSGLEGLLYIDVLKALSGDDRESYVPGFDYNRYNRVTNPSPCGNEAIAAVLMRALESELASAA